jgi:hypothetical protein
MSLNLKKLILNTAVVLLFLHLVQSVNDVSSENTNLRQIDDLVNINDRLRPEVQALADIIDIFFISQNVSFDIVIIGNKSFDVFDIINGVRSKIAMVPIWLIIEPFNDYVEREWRISLKENSIIFFDQNKFEGFSNFTIYNVYSTYSTFIVYLYGELKYEKHWSSKIH